MLQPVVPSSLFRVLTSIIRGANNMVRPAAGWRQCLSLLWLRCACMPRGCCCGCTPGLGCSGAAQRSAPPSSAHNMRVPPLAPAAQVGGISFVMIAKALGVQKAGEAQPAPAPADAKGKDKKKKK